MSGKQKCFCLQAKFVFVTHVSRAAKLGNISTRNNVSATVFPSLARPLELYRDISSDYQPQGKGFFFILVLSCIFAILGLHASPSISAVVLSGNQFYNFVLA